MSAVRQVGSSEAAAQRGLNDDGSAMIAVAIGYARETLLATQQQLRPGISPGLGFASSQPRCVSSTPPTCGLHPAVPMKMISDIWLHGQKSSTITTGVFIKLLQIRALIFSHSQCMIWMGRGFFPKFVRVADTRLKERTQ